MMGKMTDDPDFFSWPLEGMSLIEASAGTGKTWHICSLYIRLLLEKGLRVSEILVVTFTNAATAELKDRIRQRIVDTLSFLDDAHGSALIIPEALDPFFGMLVKWMEERDVDRKEVQATLKSALVSFDEAAISTIHGFCQKVIDSRAFGAGEAFSFSVQHEEREIVMDVVHDFWRRNIAADDVDPLLLRYLHSRSVSPDVLYAFLSRKMAKPLAKELWPEDLQDVQGIDFALLDTAFSDLRMCWKEDRGSVFSLVMDAAENGHLNGISYKKSTIEKMVVEYDGLFSWEDPLCLHIRPDSEAEKRLVRLTHSGLEEKVNRGKVLPEHGFFVLAERWHGLRRQVLAELERAYLRLLRRLSAEVDEVRERRMEKRVVSSDDQLFRLYSALKMQGESFAASVREMFPAALVDEFQDTDPVQFSVFDMVYANTGMPVFFVGDPKQAIYRFRHADLYTYLRAKGNVNALYSLTENYRSTPGMIAACNAFFSRNRRAFMLEGLDYPVVSAADRPKDLFLDKSGYGDAASSLFVWKLPSSEGKVLLRRDALAASAEAVADEVARLLSAAQDGEIAIGERSFKASDMAILVRKHKEGRLVQQALAKRHIASVSLSPDSVWKTLEAHEIALILSAMLMPRHPMRLRAALATEIIGFDAEAIDALSSDDEQQLAHLEEFMAYQSLWPGHGAGFVLRQLITRHDVYSRMLLRYDGERRLTNILQIIELLNQAEPMHPSPDALLQWMHVQMNERQPGEDAQMRLESDEKLVRILTIYAAKGLEFPVVFCPFLWDGYRRPASNPLPGLEYHDGDGFFIDYRSHDAKTREAIRSQNRVEDAADATRLVYVALTRAVYRCYVIAGNYLQQAGKGKSTTESTRSMLNWVVAGDGFTHEDWFRADKKEDRAARIDAAWQAMAKACPHVFLEDLPFHEKAFSLLSSRDEPLPLLRALPMPGSISQGWRIGSYSSLVYGAYHEAGGNDHDERILRPAVADTPSVVPDEDDILCFPASAYAGNCLHAVFEKVDFTDEAGWDSAIASALSLHPPLAGTAAGRVNGSPGLWPKMIRTMLRDVTATPLREGIRLGNIPVSGRLVEMAFFLPSDDLSTDAIHALLSPHYSVPVLAFQRLKGFLKGFIDLVFEHDGRFYIADWKSNYLGNERKDYDVPAMESAMSQHGYHLQHLIYTVVLHRYLKRRLPGYVFEKHFGGIFYLFVRGIRPGWVTEDGGPCGVFFHRVDESLLSRLEVLLCGHSREVVPIFPISGVPV